MSEFDQMGWLDRIGYVGPATPTLETLNRLILAQAHSIAYETMDIMLGRPPRLDVSTLQRKMISDRRGGYCFEQNMLFRAGLRSIGFNITSLQGRVVRGLAIDAPRPAIHMLLRVELPEGPYLADVGFGNLAPTSALLLAPQIEQQTPHEVMRFIDVGGELTLQARLGDRWHHIYRVIPYLATMANTRSRIGIPRRTRRRRIKATSSPQSRGQTEAGSPCTTDGLRCAMRTGTPRNAGCKPRVSSKRSCGDNSSLIFPIATSKTASRS